MPHPTLGYTLTGCYRSQANHAGSKRKQYVIQFKSERHTIDGSELFITDRKQEFVPLVQLTPEQLWLIAVASEKGLSIRPIVRELLTPKEYEQFKLYNK